MEAKRIIPCLDVRGGRVVKGVNFENTKDVGDPVLCAIEYDRQKADELVLLDIDATVEKRRTIIDVVRDAAGSISIPLSVGGGIRTIEDFRDILDAGAAKVAVNSAAVKNPELIRQAVEQFGSEHVVLAIDGKRPDAEADEYVQSKKFTVVVSGGRVDTGIDLVTWARYGAELGACEILLTSWDADGTKGGFDHDMINAVCEVVSIPVIASGGGGSLASFVDLFLETDADAALAASVFHFGELSVGQVKEYLRGR